MRPYIFLLAVLLCTTGCYKDLGNYDYRDVNEVGIAGIESQYTILSLDTLRINPVLTFTQDAKGDTADYEYEWIAILDEGDRVFPDVKRTEVARTRNLNYKVVLKPNAGFTMSYRVKDKQTGIQWSKTFRLEVKSTIYEGWLLYSDVNTDARLDMISRLDDTTERIYIDVLAQVGCELPPQKHPRHVTYATKNQGGGIYLSAGTGTNSIHAETFLWQPSNAIEYEMQGKPPAGFAPLYVSNMDNVEHVMITEDEIYYQHFIFAAGYTLPINSIQAEGALFKPAPFFGFSNRIASNMVIYDETNRRFVGYKGSQTYSYLLQDPPDGLFSYYTGRRMLYMANTRYSNNDVFAILKDDATNKTWLYRMNVSTGITQTYYGEMTGTDIDKAESFAVSHQFGYIFYNVGSRIYEYDMFNRNSKLMLDMGTEKISLIKCQNFNGSSKYAAFEKALIVCTYAPGKPAAEQGTMRLYDVPAVNGDLVLTKTYTGFGKIVDVAYRTR